MASGGMTCLACILLKLHIIVKLLVSYSGYRVWVTKQVCSSHVHGDDHAPCTISTGYPNILVRSSRLQLICVCAGAVRLDSRGSRLCQCCAVQDHGRHQLGKHLSQRLILFQAFADAFAIPELCHHGQKHQQCHRH